MIHFYFLDAELSKHSKEFYSSLPHKPGSPENRPITSLRVLAQKQDLCQLVRDIVAVSESTNWSVRSGPEAKYRALRCDIEHLDPTSLEYASVKDHIVNSQDRLVQGLFGISPLEKRKSFFLPWGRVYLREKEFPFLPWGKLFFFLFPPPREEPWGKK